jgi:hypothetical protein
MEVLKQTFVCETARIFCAKSIATLSAGKYIILFALNAKSDIIIKAGFQIAVALHMYGHMYTHVYIDICTHILTCIYKSINIYLYTQILKTYACIYINSHIRIFICIRAHI